MASTNINGYTVIATVNPTYGAIFYEIKKPDGSELFTASASSGVFGGLNNLTNKANDAGNTDLANQLSNLRSALITQLPGLDQQALEEHSAAVKAAKAAAEAEKAKTEKEKEEEKSGQKISETDAQGETAKKGENKESDDNSSPSTAAKQPASTNSNSAVPEIVVTANKNRNTITKPTVGKRTWNPLGDFSSYTYRISLYALSPDAHNTYKQTGQWDKNQLVLLVQSGGASKEEKRGEGFELDYYIDDLELTSWINAKESGMATNSIFYKFKIVEPYGMTFPTKLVEQQVKLQETSTIKREVKDFVSATHGALLLTVRFYGYDENGQIVTSSKYNNGSFNKNLDDSATFERSFTIFITKLNFKLEGKGAVYDVECRLFDQQVGAGTKRSELVGSFNGVGATVKEAIGGVTGTTSGILDQMNKFQQDSKKEGNCEIPDVYAVQYEENSTIKNSSLLDENINKDRVPMTSVNSTAASNARKQASAAASTLKQSRTITFTKGTTIIQAIDQIITQSSYVDDALTTIESEENQSAQQGQDNREQNSNPTTIKWYMITPSVEILGYDKIRNDYAYKITYVIQSYDIPYVQSTSLKYVPKYPGPHKIYNYWYTGKNSEVLSYDQSLNNLYYLYSSMRGIADENFDKEAVKGIPTQPKPSSNADPTGKPSGTGEGANNIKTFLYSPTDQVHAKIRILGDPDFLMPVSSGTIGQMMEKWYGPDFTINPNSGQVFIEIIFNQVDDYSNRDGLLKPDGDIQTMLFTPRSESLKSIIKGTVFMVLKVVSKFSKGKFTQEFTTAIPNPDNLAIDGVGNTSTGGSGSGRTNQSNAQREQQRLAEAQRQSGSGSGYIKEQQRLAKIQAQAGSGSNYIKGPVAVSLTPDDDQLVIAGPAYKKEYKQANFYNGEVEREHAKKTDPANKSNKYYGLNSNAGAGRGKGY